MTTMLALAGLVVLVMLVRSRRRRTAGDEPAQPKARNLGARPAVRLPRSTLPADTWRAARAHAEQRRKDNESWAG